jgi:hypothetical protein
MVGDFTVIKSSISTMTSSALASLLLEGSVSNVLTWKIPHVSSTVQSYEKSNVEK